MKTDGHDKKTITLFSHKGVKYMMTSSNNDFIWGSVVIQETDTHVKCRRGRPRKISNDDLPQALVS